MSRINPCPVCGSPAELIDVADMYHNVINAFYVGTVVNAFYVGCSKCCIRGDEHSHAEDAIEEWNSLGNTYKFSKEIPTVTKSYYWYRETDKEPAIGYLNEKCITFLGGEYVYLEQAKGEFAGPIKMPVN